MRQQPLPYNVRKQGEKKRKTPNENSRIAKNEDPSLQPTIIDSINTIIHTKQPPLDRHQRKEYTSGQKKRKLFKPEAPR